jgi:hypothetical protein
LIHHVTEPFPDIICIHPTNRIQLWSSRPLANSVPDASDDRAFNEQVVCSFKIPYTQLAKILVWPLPHL